MREWTKPDDAIHEITYLGEEGKRELLDLTEEFPRLEKDGIRQYKRLSKVSQGYYHGLFALLLHSMIYDSEKHVKILEFLPGSGIS